LARLEKDFETNPPFKAEPEMALLFFGVAAIRPGLKESLVAAKGLH
jgi:hypothetical protein